MRQQRIEQPAVGLPLGVGHVQRIQVPGEAHPLGDILREAVLPDRIVHAAVAVHPDAVVVGADGGSVTARVPLAAHSLRIVEDLAESQYYAGPPARAQCSQTRSEEHTSELQSHVNLVCRLLLEKKKKTKFRRSVQKNKKKRTK